MAAVVQSLHQLQADDEKFYENLSNDIEKLAWMAKAVIGLTIALWFALVAGGLYCVFVAPDALHNKFISLATQVLLPLYQSTAAVVLTYIFGKPVIRAAARRIGTRRR